MNQNREGYTSDSTSREKHEPHVLGGYASLRDIFAAMATHAIIRSGNAGIIIPETAYKIADAMMEESSK